MSAVAQSTIGMADAQSRQKDLVDFFGFFLLLGLWVFLFLSAASRSFPGEDDLPLEREGVGDLLLVS